MSYSDLGNEDRIELESLRKLLYRAIVELSYCQAAETLSLVTSEEGINIIESGVKLLGVEDLRYQELPIRLVRA